MNWFRWLAVFLVLAFRAAAAVEDPGKAKIGWVEVSVYHATDSAPKKSAAKTRQVPKEIIERMRTVKPLKFGHYALLGSDIQPLLRSYESWAQPLTPSNEVLVRFEAQGRPTRKTAVLDLELWLARKKIFKMDARLEGGRPLCVLGPEYRGGHLIVAVALASEPKAAP
jgi:hypothetical protein